MNTPAIPTPVEISAEVKHALVIGIKKAIEVYQSVDLLDKSLTYKQTLGTIKGLRSLFTAYNEHPELIDPLMIDKNGKVVRDKTTPLSCGLTLADIEQLLVKTCAKHHFDRNQPEEVVIDTVVTKKFMFLNKIEKIARKATAPGADRKTRELLRYIAYEWQIELIPSYAELNIAQLMEIGDDLLALNSMETIRAMTKYEAPTIRKVREAVGNDFATILTERPEAITGITAWNHDMYSFYRGLLGDRAWQFFAREPSFFNVVASLDKPLARVYGDVLCFISNESLEEMQRLNIDKVDVLIASLCGALGEKAFQALGKQGFVQEFLRKMVDNLLHMTQGKEQLLMSTEVTCNAMAPQIIEWLNKR